MPDGSDNPDRQVEDTPDHLVEDTRDQPVDHSRDQSAEDQPVDDPDHPVEDSPDRPLDLGDLGAKTGFVPVFTEHRAGPIRAFSEKVPTEVLEQPYDPGESWAISPDGERMWGKHGAAGLLVLDRERGVLLQHRAKWNHFGGTWGIPGGALNSDESPMEGALREAQEETAVDPEALDPLFVRTLDLGYWKYTTFAALVTHRFQARAVDAESAGVAWVQPREVRRLKLHPAFGEGWPTLWQLTEHRPALVMDVANVLGARSDGWWRDRLLATSRLLHRAAVLAETGVPASLFGLEADISWPDILVVLEGRGRDARVPRDHRGLFPRRLAPVRAPGSGDDEIVAQVRDVVETQPGRPILVATSDRQLRNRVAELGVGTISGGRMRALLERAASRRETPDAARLTRRSPQGPSA